MDVEDAIEPILIIIGLIMAFSGIIGGIFSTNNPPLVPTSSYIINTGLIVSIVVAAIGIALVFFGILLMVQDRD